MKRILLAIFILGSYVASAQTVGQFRYDTTKFLKVGGRNHVMIENLITTTDSVPKPLVVGADGVIKKSSSWFGTGGGSGSIEYILQGYGIKVDSVGRLYTIKLDSSVISGVITGGDTTILESTLDSTGQPNNRLLFSRNRKISSNPKLLTDSANTRVIINGNNVSVGGPNTKLWVGGNTTITGQETLQNIPTTNDTTTYKMMVVGADGVLRKRTYYPQPTYYPSLNLASNYILALNDSTIYFDSCLVATDITRVGDSLKLMSGCGVRLGAVYAPVGGGGGAAPGGLDTYVQYNDGGTFGGDAGMRYNDSLKSFEVDGWVTSDTLYGGTSSGGNLKLFSTQNGTKGKIYLGASSVYDELNTRLGIGNTSPAFVVDVEQDVNGASRIWHKNLNAGTGATALVDIRNNANEALQFGITSTGWIAGSNPEYPAKTTYIASFLTNHHNIVYPGYSTKWWVEHDNIMTLFSNGALNIGATTDSVSGKLVVNGDELITGSTTIGNSSAETLVRIKSAASTVAGTYYYQNGSLRSLFGVVGVASQLINGTSTGDFAFRNASDIFISADAGTTANIQVKTSGVVRFGSYTAGTATFDGSGNITSSSDRRIKNNIKDFKYGLAEVLKLRPRTFRYNADSTNTDMSGFIAQEVQAVIPGAVHAANDKQGTLSLETNAILAALVNGMQEQQKQIEELKAEVKALKK